MSKICVVGLDVGTTAIKGILVDEDGNILTKSDYPLKLISPKPGWAEEDPNEWWNGVKVVLKSLSTYAREHGIRISAISTSGQMHSLVAVDKSGEPLFNSILWCDQRTGKECDEITQKLGGEHKAIEITGNPILTGFTAGKILWLSRNYPEVFTKSHMFMLPKDFINFKLTNVYSTEHSDASGTAIYDIRKREWNNEILEILNLKVEQLPEIKKSNSIVGKITPETAYELGLDEEIIVVPGGADNACAALGVGVTDYDTAMVSVGTSGTVLVPTPTAKPDEEGRVHVFAHVVDGVNYYMGVMLSATNSLDWFNDITDFRDYDIINSEVDRVPAGARGLFFLPYLNGERTPHRDPNARGVLFGLSSAHNRFEIYKAIYEGVAYGLKDCYVHIPSANVKEFRITGGGSKSKVWTQIIADVIGKRLVKVSSKEGGAYGAAILAYSAVSGNAPDKVAKEWISITDSTEPNKERHEIYERNYEIFKSLYHSLKGAFESVARSYE
ncbi:MAG: xylulokinase [Fervidobacterium sp.]|uniref:Xylulose kinase n=1 Tax=Fervidobacterium gondwanense DSM 13020 TaxID=1121883 RepID=A0A1M7RRV4_FERGO|nr:xylulokinase [Fervidobacterium gondwanense]SHN48846.1 xylulokinase [Fervidobacterium gondwanense DSM 13020]